MPIIMAPGYHTSELFPCAALQMQECNIDGQGNLSMCCHLSGHGDGTGDEDVMGILDEMDFSEAYRRLDKFLRKFQKEKIAQHYNGNLMESDCFPCWYCLNYFKKVDWLKKHPKNPWSSEVWTGTAERRTKIDAGATS